MWEGHPRAGLHLGLGLRLSAGGAALREVSRSARGSGATRRGRPRGRFHPEPGTGASLGALAPVCGGFIPSVGLRFGERTRSCVPGGRELVRAQRSPLPLPSASGARGLAGHDGGAEGRASPRAGSPPGTGALCGRRGPLRGVSPLSPGLGVRCWAPDPVRGLHPERGAVVRGGGHALALRGGASWFGLSGIWLGVGRGRRVSVACFGPVRRVVAQVAVAEGWRVAWGGGSPRARGWLSRRGLGAASP